MCLRMSQPRHRADLLRNHPLARARGLKATFQIGTFCEGGGGRTLDRRGTPRHTRSPTSRCSTSSFENSVASSLKGSPSWTRPGRFRAPRGHSMPGEGRERRFSVLHPSPLHVSRPSILKGSLPESKARAATESPSPTRLQRNSGPAHHSSRAGKGLVSWPDQQHMDKAAYWNLGRKARPSLGGNPLEGAFHPTPLLTQAGSQQQQVLHACI